jgi:flagellar biosynthetic protein FliR
MILQVAPLLLVNYLLVLARSAGFIVFLPFPGATAPPAAARIVLALTLAVLMAPHASGIADPAVLRGAGAVWLLAQLVVAEAALGVALGAATSLLLASFGLAAQILGFQAGYSYVNMIDPNTQVDASILNVLLALLSGLLFFAFDLHLYLLRAIFQSLEEWPLGYFFTRPADALMMVELGNEVFKTALRLAFPIVAVLLLIDLTLGLLNQVQSRLQMLTLAFPAKIIAATALAYPVLLLAPRLFHDLAESMLEVMQALIRR